MTPINDLEQQADKEMFIKKCLERSRKIREEIAAITTVKDGINHVSIKKIEEILMRHGMQNATKPPAPL